MNDLQVPPCSPKSPENSPAPHGSWSKAAAFLNRDVKSFFSWGNAVANEPADEAPAAPALALPVASLVDFNKLPDLAFRREILDWRDDYQAAVTQTVARLQHAFLEQVEAELGNTSLLRIVFARPAHEVLQKSFARIVRRPLIAVLRKHEAQLDVIARKWALFGKVELAFDLRRLNAECQVLHDVGFKPAQKNLISSRIQSLLLEPAGIAEDFRDQGLGIFKKLLEAKKT